MQIFDLNTMKASKEKEKNVFYKAKEFKTRIIELPAGGEIPECEMSSYVIFHILEGEAAIKVNQDKTVIKKGQCLITDPSNLSMKTDKGVKIMGIQIECSK